MVSCRSIPAMLGLCLLACGSSAPSEPAKTTRLPSAPPFSGPSSSASPAPSSTAPKAQRATPATKTSANRSTTAGPPPVVTHSEGPSKTLGGLAPLPRNTTIIHFGASMADALGQKLRLELKKHAIKSVVLAKEATFIPQWAGPMMGLEGQLAWHDPGLVIIQVGGNEMAMPDPSVRKEAVQNLVKVVGDRPCIWIATPKWERGPHTGILDVIRNHCSPCRFVDTNVLISDLKRLGDRVHPTIPERTRWARFMIRWLRHNLQPTAKHPWALKKETSAPPPDSAAQR